MIELMRMDLFEYLDVITTCPNHQKKYEKERALNLRRVAARLAELTPHRAKALREAMEAGRIHFSWLLDSDELLPIDGKSRNIGRGCSSVANSASAFLVVLLLLCTASRLAVGIFGLNFAVRNNSRWLNSASFITRIFAGIFGVWHHGFKIFWTLFRGIRH